MDTILLHENYSVNEKGHFAINGHDTVELAEKFGTPLYVIDEDKVRKMCRTYKNAVSKHFENSDILYASKALSFKGMYRIAKEEGMCVDAVSAGEIYTAISAGFEPSDMFFHGNNKTDSDIAYALENNVGHFVVDNLSELDPDKLELIPSNGVILAPTTVTFYEGESVFDVLQRVCKDNNIHIEFSWTPIYNSAYIEGIHNLYEFDCGALSGWMYRVNGWYPNYGCSRYQLADGEVVEWRYTCDLGEDVGRDGSW